jgi:hypothetical protein
VAGGRLRPPGGEEGRASRTLGAARSAAAGQVCKYKYKNTQIHEYKYRAFAALPAGEKDRATPSPQLDRFHREEGRGGTGASARGLSYHSPGGALRGGYQGRGGAHRGDGGHQAERRNLRLDDRTGRLAREHLHRDDRRQLFQAKVDKYTHDTQIHTCPTRLRRSSGRGRRAQR